MNKKALAVLFVVGGFFLASMILWAFFDIRMWAPLEDGPSFRGLALLLLHLAGLGTLVAAVAELMEEA